LFLSAVITLGTAAEVEVFAQNPPAQGDNKNLEEIVVTGSRIARRDFSSQTPIVTVDKEAFTSRTAVGLEATLDQLPQFNMTGAGSAASSSASSTPFPQANAAPGAATINLRGLGLNRSLVLMDGRRIQPVNGQLVVDLNTIPAAAIDRVEVITGGAAAVYGADAIGGVVNVITKKNFEGVQINAQTAVTQEGDGNESTVNGLLGAAFADGRGAVMIGADYSKRDVIMSKNRDWVRKGWDDPGTTGGALGSSNLSQLVTPFGCGAAAPATGCGSFPLPTGGSYEIDQNGHVFNPQKPMDPAHPYTGPLGGTSGFKISPDGSLAFNDQEHSYLQVPLERYSLFGSGHVQLSDKVEVFAQLQYSSTYTVAQGFTSSLFNVWSPTVPYNHLYDDPASAQFGQAPAGTAMHPVPAEVAALLNQRGAGIDSPWTYAGGMDYFGNFETDTTADVYQLVGGLRSDFQVKGNDWNWSVYASHGNTNVNAYQPEGFPYLPRMQNLFNANQYGVNFDVNSLPGFVPVAVTGHCTSGLPIFNPNGSVNNTPYTTQDCSDWAVLRMNSVTTLEQNIFEGTVTGTIANMKSGPLQFAAGADYRKEIFGFQPDSGYNANQAFPNVVQNVLLPVSVNGTTDVKEAYAELAIPLWKDRLELDPGVRYSDYNTVGNVTTYKLLGQLKVTDWMRFRGGYQYANRAPNVVELFTPIGGSSFGTGVDPCGNWITVAGGPSLTQTWGNRASNPNRVNVQTLCQYLMTREGAPASYYVPGTPSADNWACNVFGNCGTTAFFPLDLAIQQGNPTLQSEQADTYTAGVVMNLPFAERLTLTLDWYRINLDHAIVIPSHDAVYQQCLDANYNQTIGSAPGTFTGAQMAAANPACNLIQREYLGNGPAGSPGNTGSDRKYKAQYYNEGGIESEGYDLAVNWGVGNFNVDFQTTFLQKYAESAFPGAAFTDYTGTVQNSSFDYRFLSTVRWNKGPLGLGVRLQYLPSLDPLPGSSSAVFGVDSHEQLDLFGSWSFKQRWQLRGGIDNFLNADPEWVTRTATNNAIGSTNANYDPFGRRVFIGLQITL
jgi:outer membrane receptor protein involved in Fe transport